MAAVRAARPKLFFVLSLRLLLVMGAVAPWLLWTAGLRGFPALNALLVFGSLWAFYMEFMFVVVRSMSVRTMTELVRAPQQRLSGEMLERLYGTEAMFDRRLDSMVANGYLTQVNGHLMLTARGATTARAFRLVRQVLNLRGYG
jgi:hypothetical protein